MSERPPWSADARRPILWSAGRAVSVGELARDVASLARALPPEPFLINLCEERYAFLVAFCAAIARGKTNLLPPSRAPESVAEVASAHAASYRCDDAVVHAALVAAAEPAAMEEFAAEVPARHVAVIGFTSGSTGQPKGHTKRWGGLLRSTALNASRIREQLRSRHGESAPWILATVPSQHMYGLETSVLLPLVANMGVHAGRPMFAADVAAALAELPQPRVLISTPVHLHMLAASEQRFPEIALVVSATAPMDAGLAVTIERALQTTVLEMFGSTETCVIASRRTAREAGWRLYPEVRLTPEGEGTRVDAPWFDVPNVLQDVVTLLPDGTFTLRGRNADLIEVAGKRASLADLTRRLLAFPGVRDAAVFLPEASAAGEVRRVAALVVAPGSSAEAVRAGLRDAIDPVFLPRPLVLVDELPRNEVGKLPRESLLAALRNARKRS